MPISVDYYTSLKPVNYTLVDSNYSLDCSLLHTQQGNTLLEYNFLLSANDCNIKNYTNNYLTFNFNQKDIFEVIQPQPINNAVVTTIIDSNQKLLTIISNGATTSIQPLLTAFALGSLQNFVVDFNELGKCTIWCYDNIYKKYLFIDESNNNVVQFNTLSASQLEYNYDKIYGTINLFYTLTSGDFRWISSINNQLSVIVPETSSLSAINFNITNTQPSTAYIQDNFVLYTSGGNVSDNSLTDIKNNYLFYTPYETWVPGVTSIDGTIDFLNLKNYTSKDGFANRVPFFRNKQQRNYNSIITSEYQEKSNEKLQLGYNFFTKEYLIQPDKYTKFILPTTILPFTRININDSGLKESGAYAAQSPYFSDRVYKLLDENLNNNNTNESNGILLCSWLNSIDGKWYDRYYIPQNTSYISALTSNTQQVFSYITELSAFIQNNGLQSLNFYDIASSLMFEPGCKYYYARIGEKYINNTLNGKNTNLVKGGVEAISLVDSSVSPPTTDVLLDGSIYDKVNLGNITTGRFNISFKIKTVNFENAYAYQLIGNNYNLGFSVRKNFYFTPFIILHSDNDVFFYDTDFKLIKKNTYKTAEIGQILDVYYVSQTTDITLRTTNGLYKTDINGEILYVNTNVNTGLKTSVIGRHFYGKGNRALTVTGNAIPHPVFLTDLQTLNTELYTTVTQEISSITTVGDSIISLPGKKGININDSIGASLSGDNYILFTDLDALTSYVALSTTNTIYDIIAHENNLFIQSNNFVHVFNTERELLSTIILNTSAASGFKLDFVNENYTPKLLAFSKDVNNNILIDKISLTTNEIISSYNIGLSALAISGKFVTPTGFYYTENTYKDYEGKLCLTLNLPNTFVTQPSARIWNTYTHSWSATTPVSYWAFNYSNITSLNDNSVIDIIPGDKFERHLSLDFNLLDGVISVYVDGVLSIQLNAPANLLSIGTILKNIFYIGNQNYTSGSITDIITNQEFLAKNIELSDLRIYNISLSDDFIKYLFMRGIKVDAINIDIPCDNRNTTETVDNLFRYSIPGRLSNSIIVYVKGLELNDDDKITLQNVLIDKLNNILPVNIDNITFNFDIQ